MTDKEIVISSLRDRLEELPEWTRTLHVKDFRKVNTREAMKVKVTLSKLRGNKSAYLSAQFDELKDFQRTGDRNIVSCGALSLDTLFEWEHKKVEFVAMDGSAGYFASREEATRVQLAVFWHLTSLHQGPMYYIENSLYHAREGNWEFFFDNIAYGAVAGDLEYKEPWFWNASQAQLYEFLYNRYYAMMGVFYRDLEDIAGAHNQGTPEYEGKNWYYIPQHPEEMTQEWWNMKDQNKSDRLLVIPLPLMTIEAWNEKKKQEKIKKLDNEIRWAESSIEKAHQKIALLLEEAKLAQAQIDANRRTLIELGVEPEASVDDNLTPSEEEELID